MSQLFDLLGLPRVPIRKKDWWWNFVPLVGRNKFGTFSPTTVYLPPTCYRDFSRSYPAGSTIALVAHELVHIRQFRTEGGVFFLNYVLSRKCRLCYEVEAYSIQAIVRRTFHLEVESWLKQSVKALSSWRYLFLGKGWYRNQRRSNIWKKLLETLEATGSV